MLNLVLLFSAEEQSAASVRYYKFIKVTTFFKINHIELEQHSFL